MLLETKSPDKQRKGMQIDDIKDLQAGSIEKRRIPNFLKLGDSLPEAPKKLILKQ